MTYKVDPTRLLISRSIVSLRWKSWIVSYSSVKFNSYIFTYHIKTVRD